MSQVLCVKIVVVSLFDPKGPDPSESRSAMLVHFKIYFFFPIYSQKHLKSCNYTKKYTQDTKKCVPSEPDDHTWFFCPQLPKSDLEMRTQLYRSALEMRKQLYRSDSEICTQLYRSALEMRTQLCRSDSEMSTQLYRSDLKMSKQLYRSDLEMKTQLYTVL